jgi:hypothetical protein
MVTWIRRLIMYLANEEKPTAHLRVKGRVLQQKWYVRKNYIERYEWRRLEKVDEDSPDVEDFLGEGS